MIEVAELTTEPVHQLTLEDRILRVRDVAADKFRDGPDWVTFYREVFGVDGIIDDLFPSHELRSRFERTAEYAEIQQMLAKLREKTRGQKLPDEATRVITVRLPQSLHEALRHEAHNHKTSMNKLCISKLLQMIDGNLVPSDLEQREEGASPRKRRPEHAASQATAEVASAEPTQTQPTQTEPMIPATPAETPTPAASETRPSPEYHLPPFGASPMFKPLPTSPTAGAF